MVEIPQTSTPVNAGIMDPAISAAIVQLTGRPPSNATVAIFLGLWDLETGAGKSTFNWNVGNLKAFGDQDYFVNTQVTGQNNHFAAYPSLTDGVKAWIGLLAHQKHYAATWAAAMAGDASDFSDAIAVSGYCSDAQGNPCPGYAQAVQGRIQKYMRNVSVRPPFPLGAGAVVLLFGLGLMGATLYLTKSPRTATA